MSKAAQSYQLRATRDLILDQITAAKRYAASRAWRTIGHLEEAVYWQQQAAELHRSILKRLTSGKKL